MIGLVQRVLEASVRVDGELIAAIGPGLLLLACAEPGDGPGDATRLIDKVLALRVLADKDGRMNRSLRQAGGGLLVVPQFTLAADLASGNRPGFSGAAAPDLARSLFHHAVNHARANHDPVGSGRFGADMKVSLINDGPVTIPLRMEPGKA